MLKSRLLFIFSLCIISIISTPTIAQSNCSITTGRAVITTFINRTQDVVQLDEISFDCVRELRATLQPYESYTITSYEGVDWEFNLEDAPLGKFNVPNLDRITFDILPPPATVDVDDVFKVNVSPLYDYEINRTITKISVDTWLESSIQPDDDWRQLLELSRDENAVYLYDEERNETLELNLTEGLIRSTSEEEERVAMFLIQGAYDEKLRSTNLTFIGYQGDGIDTPGGYIEEYADGVWINYESTIEAKSYLLEVIGYNDSSVFLSDPTRDIQIEINLSDARVRFDEDEFVIFETGGPVIEPLINGYNVTYTPFGADTDTMLGAYRQTEALTWVEDGINGNLGIFNFTETSRDEWSVHLFDASRGIELEIDLQVHGVFMRNNDERSLLYVTFNEG